jgi:thiol-disulfide isomerase/thioredoxin
MSRTPLLIVLTALIAGAAGFGVSRWLDAENRARLASHVATETAKEARSRLPAVSIGGKIPLREFAAPFGGEVDLAAYDGQTLVVNFWATWCAPCRKEIPILQAFDDAREDVTVIGVALDDAKAVEQYVEDLRITYPVAIETPGANDFSVELGNDRGVLPYTALVRDGRLLATKIGDFDDAAELEQWLESAGQSTN